MTDGLDVRRFFEEQKGPLELRLVAGEAGLDKEIAVPRPQKPGLALLGDTSKLYPKRVQVLGKSEITYLENLPPDKQQEIIEKICDIELACFIITRNNIAPSMLVQQCDVRRIPLLVTPQVTQPVITRVTAYLKEKLNDSQTIHGVLVSVTGVGVLIIGKSGIGKSECALDLVAKGHQLVADDMVEVVRQDAQTIQGYSSKILGYHMEVRGLGIISVKDLFGIAAVRSKKIVNLVIEMTDWSETADYDRLGTRRESYNILGVEVPYIRLPVSPARHLSTLIEVAARNELLKRTGQNTALEFSRMIDQKAFEESTDNVATDPAAKE